MSYAQTRIPPNIGTTLRVVVIFSAILALGAGLVGFMGHHNGQGVLSEENEFESAPAWDATWV